MRSKPGPPMTLSNMRANGVRGHSGDTGHQRSSFAGCNSLARGCRPFLRGTGTGRKDASRDRVTSAPYVARAHVSPDAIRKRRHY